MRGTATKIEQTPTGIVIHTVSGNEGDIYIHTSAIHTSIYSSLRADVWQAMRGWSQSTADSPLFIPYWQLPYAIVLRRVILQQLGAFSIA